VPPVTRADVEHVEALSCRPVPVAPGTDDLASANRNYRAPRCSEWVDNSTSERPGRITRRAAGMLAGSPDVPPPHADRQRNPPGRTHRFAGHSRWSTSAGTALGKGRSLSRIRQWIPSMSDERATLRFEWRGLATHSEQRGANYRAAVSIEGHLGQFVQPSNGIVYTPCCFSLMLPYSGHEMPLQLSSHSPHPTPIHSLPPPPWHHSSIATQSTPSTVERRCARTTLRCATRSTVPRRVGLLWMRADLNSASAGQGLPCDSDAPCPGPRFRVATSLCRGRTECPQRADSRSLRPSIPDLSDSCCGTIAGVR
jgi:hypothetical protein